MPSNSCALVRIALVPALIISLALQQVFATVQDAFLQPQRYESAGIEAAVGTSARLACNMTVEQNDTVYLVLWFKQGLATPVYSYDVREAPAGKHWHDADLLGTRAAFHASSGQSSTSGPSRNFGAHLLLRPVQRQDAGLYKCRVDFQRAPTSITRVNLTVIEPPNSVVLALAGRQNVRGLLGPVLEHDNLTLSCIVSGGFPLPHIKWRINGEMLIDKTQIKGNDGIAIVVLQSDIKLKFSFTSLLKTKTYSSSIDDDRGEKYELKNKLMSASKKIFINNNFDNMEKAESASMYELTNVTEVSLAQLSTTTITQSWLTLFDVGRQLLMTRLECIALNSKTLPPVSSSATLDMNLSPLGVRIILPEEPLLAKRSVDITCLSWGSRPPAVLTWWSNSTRLNIPGNLIWREGNETRAVLRISLNASHDGLSLSCKAMNPSLSEEKAVVTHATLTVQYAPLLSLTPGRNLNLDRVQQGDDAYFECSVQSRPAIRGRIIWRHNGSVMREDVSAGVLITERSLVLQAVSKERAGTYTCGAANAQGVSESTSLQLNVRYLPVCRSDIPSTYGVSLMEEAVINCHVDAFPPVQGFVWWFNNSAETLELKGDKSQGTSTLHYTPTTDLDYGTLLCLARNDVGRQQEPCSFQIIPAAHPEAPTNCSLANVTSSSVTVACLPGFDGGLSQLFVLEVYTTKPHFLYANLTAKTPRFLVGGLSGETELQLIVYSGNAKGRSGGVARLVAHTPELPVKQLETRLDTDAKVSNSSSLLGAVAGVLLVMILLCGASLSIIKIKCHKRQSNQHESISEERLKETDIEPGMTAAHEIEGTVTPENSDCSGVVTDHERLEHVSSSDNDGHLAGIDLYAVHAAAAHATAAQKHLLQVSGFPKRSIDVTSTPEQQSFQENINFKFRKTGQHLENKEYLTDHILIRNYSQGSVENVKTPAKDCNRRQYQTNVDDTKAPSSEKAPTRKDIPLCRGNSQRRHLTGSQEPHNDFRPLPVQASCSSQIISAKPPSDSACTCSLTKDSKRGEIHKGQDAFSYTCNPESTLCIIPKPTCTPHPDQSWRQSRLFTYSPEGNVSNLETKGKLLPPIKHKTQDHSYQTDVIAPALEFQDPAPDNDKALINKNDESSL